MRGGNVTVDGHLYLPRHPAPGLHPFRSVDIAPDIIPNCLVFVMGGDNLTYKIASRGRCIVDGLNLQCGLFGDASIRSRARSRISQRESAFHYRVLPQRKTLQDF